MGKRRRSWASIQLRLAHESVGEGDDRHLVLQKCEDSLIPTIMVSDVLEGNDLGLQERHSARQLLKRCTVASVLPAYLVNLTSGHDGGPSEIILNAPVCSLEERQTAYLAARDRIFSNKHFSKETDCTRPRSDPVVARRMIAHALGHPKVLSDSNPGSCLPGTEEDIPCVSSKVCDKTSISKSMVSANSAKESIQQSSMNAAKRIFANALGLPLSSPSVGVNLRLVSCKTGPGSLPSNSGLTSFTNEQKVSTFQSDLKEGTCKDVSIKKMSGGVTQLNEVSRSDRPGVAARRMMAQALGLRDPACSPEMHRHALQHRSSSLTGVSH